MKDIFIIANKTHDNLKKIQYRIYVKTVLLGELHNKGIEYFNGEPIWGIHMLSWGEAAESPYTNYRVCGGGVLEGVYEANSIEDIKGILKHLTEELHNGLNHEQAEIIIDSFN